MCSCVHTRMHKFLLFPPFSLIVVLFFIDPVTNYAECLLVYKHGHLSILFGNCLSGLGPHLICIMCYFVVYVTFSFCHMYNLQMFPPFLAVISYFIDTLLKQKNFTLLPPMFACFRCYKRNPFPSPKSVIFSTILLLVHLFHSSP